MKGFPAVLKKTISFNDMMGNLREVLAGNYIEVMEIGKGTVYSDGKGQMRVHTEPSYVASYAGEMFDIERNEFYAVS
jgi:hypothetical protein